MNSFATRTRSVRALVALLFIAGAGLTAMTAHAQAPNIVPQPGVHDSLTVGHIHLFPNREWVQTHEPQGKFKPQNTVHDLIYHGGPVQRSPRAYAIFWQPPGTHYEPPNLVNGDASFKNLVTRYFGDVGGSAFYHVLQQYTDQSLLPVANSATLAGVWTDTRPYPQLGTIPNPLLDSDIQAEAFLAANHFHDGGINAQFFIFTTRFVQTCVTSLHLDCSFTTYCAYHTSFLSFVDGSPQRIMYANMPDVDQIANSCDPGMSPNGDAYADSEINVLSHEQFEMASDPEVDANSAWWDPTKNVGGEIGDKCAWTFGTVNVDGSNAISHGHHYILQREYDNLSHSCLQDPCATKLCLSSLSVNLLSHFTTNASKSPMLQYTLQYRNVGQVTAIAQATIHVMLDSHLKLPPTPVGAQLPEQQGCVSTVTTCPGDTASFVVRNLGPGAGGEFTIAVPLPALDRGTPLTTSAMLDTGDGSGVPVINTVVVGHPAPQVMWGGDVEATYGMWLTHRGALKCGDASMDCTVTAHALPNGLMLKSDGRILQLIGMPMSQVDDSLIESGIPSTLTLTDRFGAHIEQHFRIFLRRASVDVRGDSRNPTTVPSDQLMLNAQLMSPSAPGGDLNTAGPVTFTLIPLGFMSAPFDGSGIGSIDGVIPYGHPTDRIRQYACTAQPPMLSDLMHAATTCDFSGDGVLPNTYDVHVDVGGNTYMGGTDFLVTVQAPSK